MNSSFNPTHAALVLLFILAGPPSEVARAVPPTTPAKVGVLTDNYPFSYRDEDGRIKGFAYEFLQQIEQVMNLKFERVEGTTKEINAAFREGKIDLLQSFARSPDRARTAEFSVPYLSMTGQIFVRKGGPEPASFADLKDRQVLVHPGSLGEHVLRDAGLSNSIVYVDSVEQALIKLERGEGDATLATRLTGLSLAKLHGLTQLRVLDLPVENFEVDYCFAAQKGDLARLTAINEGMAILARTGRFDALYQKWFGFIAPKGYSKEQVLLAVAIGLLVALLVALWAGIRQSILRRKLGEQTASLREREASLALAQAHAHLGSWELDLATEKITWSREMFHMHYCDPSQPAPSFAEFLEMVHPDDRQRILRAKAELPEITTRPDNAYRTNPSRGPVRYINATVYLIQDAANQPTRVAGTSLDITDRHQAEVAMRAAVRRLEFIAQMTGTVIGSSTTAEVAQRLAAQAQECYEVDACVIRILENDQLVLLGAHGVPEDRLAPQLPVFGLSEKIFSSRQPLVISNVYTHPLTKNFSTPTPGAFSFVSYAGVPLITEGRIVGVLGIYTTERPREYSSLDLEHLQIIANHAAVSLSNERLFKMVRAQKTQLESNIAERERVEAALRVSTNQLRALTVRLEKSREEERIRISREIHDELGQKLTGLKMDLHSVENRLAQIADEDLRVALEDKVVAASAAADDTMVTIQRIAAELRPAMLDNLGLVAALRFEASQFESRTRIPVTLQLPLLAPALPGNVATAVYRILQEVLTNVARHARATHVAVTLEIASGRLTLQVQDNGIGINSEALLSPTSLGLLGMAERAAMVNGQVRFESGPGKGTTVRLDISIESLPV